MAPRSASALLAFGAAAALVAAPAAAGAGYSAKPRTGGASAATAQGVLARVTGGLHPGFDRVVFTFAGARPAFRTRFVRELVMDGSGSVIPTGRKPILEIAFTNARAHTLAGAPTRAAVILTPKVPRILTQAIRSGDFEGIVSYGLVLERRTVYRVLTLGSPHRVVIDLKR